MKPMMQATFGKKTPYLHWGDTKLNHGLDSYSKRDSAETATSKQFYNTDTDYEMIMW